MFQLLVDVCLSPFLFDDNNQSLVYIVEKVDADPPPWIIVIVVVVVVTVLEKTKYPMSSVNGHFQGGAGPGCDDNELGDDNHDVDVVD